MLKNIDTVDGDGNTMETNNDSDEKSQIEIVNITPEKPENNTTPGANNNNKNNNLSKILLKVQYINDIRQELINKTYIFPHKCKLYISIFMWIYIFIAFISVIYLGTQFNGMYISEADNNELLLYNCNNTIPYEIKLNYKISQLYAENINITNKYSPYSRLNGNNGEILSNSTKW
eukprot:203132_1